MAIKISTPQDLHNVRNNLTGDYELVNDIDMSNWGNWETIAPTSSERFTGTIDGKGYKILNLNINNTQNFTAFIGWTNTDAKIKNIGFENANVIGGNYASILVSRPYNLIVENVYLTGELQGLTYIAPFAANSNNSHFTNCYSHVNVTTNVSDIGNQYNAGFVSFNSSLGTYTNCYSTGRVTSPNKTEKGFIGQVNTNAPYRTIITNCFWDTQTSGRTTTAGTSATGIPQGKTSAEMKTQSTFTDWDFENVWYMDDVTGYPALKTFSDLPTSKKETITVNSYTNPLQANLSKSIQATKSLQANLSRIYTVNNKQKKTQRVNVTYTLPIHSNVQKSIRQVRNMTVNVDTHIKPIGSYANRESKTIRQLISHLKPLQADISVLYPLRDIPVYATVSVIYNPSVASLSENMSRSHYIVNPSNVEVI